ncbi:MAG: TIM barrel protein [Acidobacteria bacterium]|nr:TIM barrel protein [Acidobacteriota bacterium]MYC83557.1 TIM barrel protein [Acidobacteriota bacterium]
MDVKIGSAPDSWGVWFPSDDKQIPWQRCLDEIAEAGYQWTELGPYGYLPTDRATLQDELSKRGLRASGTFAMGHLEDDEAWPGLEKQVLGAGESLAYLGAEYLILIDDTYTNLWTGEATAPGKLDDEAWKRLVDRIHYVVDLVRERFGLQVVFHPHAETHVEYEDQIERLLSQTDPERVVLCLDTGHHAYRGGDPISFLRRHHRRIPYLHLKSVRPDLQKKVAEENIPFAHAVGMDLFCEPSRGVVDFPALCRVLQEIDYNGYAIVEQDMYPAPFDKPLPIARRTREYLRSIGIG